MKVDRKRWYLLLFGRLYSSKSQMKRFGHFGQPQAITWLVGTLDEGEEEEEE